MRQAGQLYVTPTELGVQLEGTATFNIRFRAEGDVGA